MPRLNSRSPRGENAITEEFDVPILSQVFASKRDLRERKEKGNECIHDVGLDLILHSIRNGGDLVPFRIGEARGVTLSVDDFFREDSDGTGGLEYVFVVGKNAVGCECAADLPRARGLGCYSRGLWCDRH